MFGLDGAERRTGGAGRNAEQLHHLFYDCDFVAFYVIAQCVERMDVLDEDFVECVEVLRLASGGYGESDLGAEVRDRTGEGLDPDGPIAAGAIVAEATDPGETIAEFGHDALVHTDVALAVLPDFERGNGVGKAGDLIGSEGGPIAGIEGEGEACCVGDGLVIGDPTRFWGVDVVGRHHEEGVGTGFLHAAGHIATDGGVVTDASDDRHAALGGFDGDSDDLGRFFGSQGIDFAGAACGDYGAVGVTGHFIDVLFESGQVEGEVLFEGRDGEAEDATELVAKFGHAG